MNEDGEKQLTLVEVVLEQAGHYAAVDADITLFVRKALSVLLKAEAGLLKVDGEI